MTSNDDIDVACPKNHFPELVRVLPQSRRYKRFLRKLNSFLFAVFFPFFSDLQVSVQVSGALGWFLCESTCQFVFILMWRVENDKQNPLKMSLVLRKSSFANGSSQNSSWNLFKSQLWWTVDKISTCYEGNKCYSKMNKLTIKKIKMLQILWSVDSWKKICCDEWSSNKQTKSINCCASTAGIIKMTIVI